MESEQVAKSNENIVVAVRVRPLNSKELSEKEKDAWVVDSAATTISQKRTLQKSKNAELLAWKFNHIFDQESTTKDLFNVVVGNLVESTLAGINGTIFA